jgi:hypothetical protein
MSSARDRWAGAGLILLGAGVAASSLLGPLVAGVIRYRVSGDMLNQVIGGDAVSLAIVAPACVAVGVLFLRGHPAAPVLALPPAAYAAYVFSQLILGGEHLRLPGNSEQFFPLHLGIFVLSGAVAILAWGAIDADALPRPSRRTERLAGALMLAVAGLLVLGLHLPGLVDALGEGPASAEYLENPTVFWVVKLMDLGIVVPVALAAGIGLLRGAAWARRPAYAVVGWFVLLGAFVSAMAIVMVARDDPDASVLFVVASPLLVVGFAAVAASLYRPLLRSRAR